MAKHIWTVLCRRAITEGASNIISLIDVIEEMAVGAKPPITDSNWNAIPIEALIVSFLERSDAMIPEQCQVKVDIVSPSGEIHAQRLFANIGLANSVRARSIFKLEGLPIRGFGTHRFVASLRKNDDDTWVQVADVPLQYKPLNEEPQIAMAKTESPKQGKPKKGGGR